MGKEDKEIKMSDKSPKPEILINKSSDGHTVAKSINSYLEHLRSVLKEAPCLSIATGYFNLGGYALLAGELNQLTNVKILLGAEPREPENRMRSFTSIKSEKKNSYQEEFEALEKSIFYDRNHLGFSLETEQIVRQLTDWLQSDSVETRQLKGQLLHGKAYIVSNSSENEGEGVIVGSSNFTHAGLSKNIELNLGQYQPSPIRKVKEWFEELWDQADEFPLADYYAELYQEFDPYLIFLRMLWEYYKIDMESKESSVNLAEFQKHGLSRAKQILEDKNGVLIADEVGLGKTYIAGELVRRVVQEERKRALLIAPATLRDSTWKEFLEEYSIYCQVLSYEQLINDKQLNPETENPREHLRSAPESYSLIVIDEAHNLRNRKTKKALAVKNLLRGSPPKQLVLLTATPVNNSLDDLENLLGYFLKDDSAFLHKGIPSISQKFKEAKEKDPEFLSPGILHTLLDNVAVRRTRTFIEENYPDEEINEIRISFPKPKLHPVIYNLDDVLPEEFFKDFANKLEGRNEADESEYLKLAAYTVSKYRRKTKSNVEHKEANISGFMRMTLLKRLESSIQAFTKTCQNLINRHEILLDFIENGQIPVATTLTEWIATDSDDLEEYLEELEDEAMTESIDDYDCESLIKDVESDKQILNGFLNAVTNIKAKDDPKLKELSIELAEIAREAREDGKSPSTADKRKVIIFSFYTDTIEWVHDYLDEAISKDPQLADYRGRLAPIVSGQTAEAKTTETINDFSPKTTGTSSSKKETDLDGKYDILIASDVLAEGLNLQQARHIINYDLPWNPMRLVQRQGRINRLKSEHDEITLRCIYPDAQLDELLRLEERLLDKIGRAAGSIGSSAVLPGGREVEKILRGENEDFIKSGRVKGEIIEAEEFRWELRKALADNLILKTKLNQLPWGAGSGFVANEKNQAGFIFCARVGDDSESEPHFRFIPWEFDDLAKDKEELKDKGFESEHFVCLTYARNEKETVRMLDDTAKEKAHLAWQKAREDICRKWREDNTSLSKSTRIPKSIRDATELIKQHGKTRLGGEEVEELYDLFNQLLHREIQVEIGKILKSEDLSIGDKVEKLQQLAKDEGLQPIEFTPRPEIKPDNVNLIAWLAISPDSVE